MKVQFSELKDRTSSVLRGTILDRFADRSWATASRPIKVMVVQPPAAGGVKSLLPQMKNDGGIGFKPPLGILYVATVVKEWSSNDVAVLDCQAERLSLEESLKRIIEFSPDVVGISAWTDWWYPAFKLGEMIKERLPGTHLTYGGPHLGIYPEVTLEIPFVDSVIVGDGEVPFMVLCNMVANGTLDNSFPGLHFRSGGVKPLTEEKFYIHKDLDSLPIPDRTLLSLSNYTSVIGKNDSITTMITSRGCPYLCTFCKLNFQKTLTHSADRVVEEFARIQGLGIKEVEVYDDTFTWSRKRVMEICDKMKERGINLRWAIRDRVTSANDEMLTALREVGCIRIHYGIESGSDKVIDLMKKKITTKQARHAVDLAGKKGFTVLTYFMFGNLGETIDDMKDTINFALDLNSDFAEFSITIPYAGTEMYLEALRSNIITEDYWLSYARNPAPDFAVPSVIENLVPIKTMLELRDAAIRKFYFRPEYVLSQIRNVSSIGELKRKSSMALSLFRHAYVSNC